MKNITKIIIIFAVLLAAALTAYFFLRDQKILLQGEVVMRQINLSPKVPGRVLEILVSEGDDVKKGDIIAKIDSPEILAKSEQARAVMRGASAQYQTAQKTYGRVEELYKGGVVPAQKIDETKGLYDTALAATQQAKGAVSEIESYVNETVLTAPRDGNVNSIIVEEGELVSPGFAVATMLDEADVWLTFNVREDLLKHLSMGDEAEVEIPATGKKYKFKVTFIAKQGDFAVWSATKTRGEFELKTFEVRMKPLDGADKLRSGMSAAFYVKK